MIQNYIDAFNVSPVSPRFRLLLDYYDISQEYERNFETLHEAWRNGDLETHKYHLAIEADLYKKCKKLRDILRPGIDNDINDTAKPNAICNQCRSKYVKATREDLNTGHKSTGICKDCVRLNAKEKRNQSKVNQGLIDITTKMDIMPS